MRASTVRIVASHPETQGPFVIIDEARYDPAVHQLYDEPAAGSDSSPPPAEQDTEITTIRRTRRKA